MLFFFFLFSKRSNGARRGMKRSARNSNCPSTEKCWEDWEEQTSTCEHLTWLPIDWHPLRNTPSLALKRTFFPSLSAVYLLRFQNDVIPTIQLLTNNTKLKHREQRQHSKNSLPLTTADCPIHQHTRGNAIMTTATIICQRLSRTAASWQLFPGCHQGHRRLNLGLWTLPKERRAPLETACPCSPQLGQYEETWRVPFPDLADGRNVGENNSTDNAGPEPCRVLKN